MQLSEHTENKGNFSLYHLSRPPRVAPKAGEKAPLLILLHGVGSHEHDLFGLANYLDARFFVISVRAPLNYHTGYGWFPIQFTPEGILADEEQAKRSRDLIQKFIGEATEAFGTDPKQVYLTGFSQGAIMSLYLALHQPELVAGVVAMSGRLLPDTLAARADDSRLSSLPVFAVHGVYDQVLPIAEGRWIQSELSKLPLDFSYQEYPMGHEVSQESLTDIAQFLKRQLDKKLV